jgi:hypothetical protein
MCTYIAVPERTSQIKIMGFNVFYFLQYDDEYRPLKTSGSRTLRARRKKK